MAKKKEQAEKRLIKSRISAKEIYLVTANVRFEGGSALVEDFMLTVNDRHVEFDRLVNSFGEAKAKAEIAKSVQAVIGNGFKITVL